MANGQPNSNEALSQPLSPLATRLLARAQAEIDSGHVDAAERTLTSALALAPDNIGVIQQMGMVSQARGDHARAVDCFRRVLVAKPDDADARVWLGIALFQYGEADEAIAQLRRACELAPDSISAWYNLGEMLRPRGCTREALVAFERTLVLDPVHTPAMLALARAQASIGQIDAAVAGLREILRREPANAEVWFELSNLKAVQFDGGELEYLKQAFAEKNNALNVQIWFGFALARALEDHGEYARAFDVLEVANALQRRTIAWDAAGEHARVAAIFRAWRKPFSHAQNAELGRSVVFLACVPRSGSTLVEQILASHPAVEGANEIKDLQQVVNAETARRFSAFPLWLPDASAADWQRLGEEYLARTSRWRHQKPNFTDKSLANWMLLGAALTMLPAARAVVVRRDPVETCLACYRQWFAEAAGFSNDLDEMADYCIDFWHVTRFWLNKFPERVFDFEYEKLLAEPEPTIRRLLDFCGLPFDPACLEFHRTERTVLSSPSAAQVRQPLQRSTARAAHYGHLLDGLRKRLHDAGLPVAEI